MNPLLSEHLLRQRIRIASPFIEGRILDVGCGILISKIDHRRFSEYVGIDRHPEIIAWLENNFPDQRFIQQDFEEHLLPDIGTFDTILLLAVIEHLSDPNLFLSQLPSLLTPNGKVVITTPTPLGIQLHAIGAKMNLTYRSAADEHKARYSASDLSHLLQNHGMSVKVCRKFLIGLNILCVGQSHDD